MMLIRTARAGANGFVFGALIRLALWISSATAGWSTWRGLTMPVWGSSILDSSHNTWYTYYVEVDMANVTMSIDDSLLRRARKIAVDRDSTLSDMYRAFLDQLVKQEDVRRGFTAKELDALFGQSQASSGGRIWSRDELHER